MYNDRIKNYYAQGGELNRLEEAVFRLEGIRTKEIVRRYLQETPMRIADIGGGTGYYAYWLQQMGHRVTLLDLSAENIAAASALFERYGIKLEAYHEGDATSLPFPEGHFDLVLLLGPLYHLTERSARIKVLSEAMRVLKSGGVLLAAVISRYASLFDGFRRDLVLDDHFFDLMKNDLQTGIHLNETNNPEYFTTAFFHTPAAIREEITTAGLAFEKLIAIESFGWVIDNFTSRSSDLTYMKKLQTAISLVESNDDLVAMSPHIMSVARKS